MNLLVDNPAEPAAREPAGGMLSGERSPRVSLLAVVRSERIVHVEAVLCVMSSLVSDNQNDPRRGSS